eukprot:2352239-Pyramimonas_sp.AAC.1
MPLRTVSLLALLSAGLGRAAERPERARGLQGPRGTRDGRRRHLGTVTRAQGPAPWELVLGTLAAAQVTGARVGVREVA